MVELFANCGNPDQMPQEDFIDLVEFQSFFGRVFFFFFFLKKTFKIGMSRRSLGFIRGLPFFKVVCYLYSSVDCFHIW